MQEAAAAAKKAVEGTEAAIAVAAEVEAANKAEAPREAVRTFHAERTTRLSSSVQQCSALGRLIKLLDLGALGAHS